MHLVRTTRIRCGFAFALAMCLTLSAAAADPKPAVPAAIPLEFDFSEVAKKSGEEIFAQVCAACHGPKGEGNLLLKSPALAGMPSYYLLAQIDKFRNGHRGDDRPGEVAGAQMRSVASAIPDEVAKKVAGHIEDMDAILTSVELGGDSKRGKIEYAEHCMACHRFNGKGEIVFGSPPLVTLPDWYLFEQLQDFRDGHRGAVAADENGKKMREATAELPDEILKDIVTYIGELAAGREPKGSIWQ